MRLFRCLRNKTVQQPEPVVVEEEHPLFITKIDNIEVAKALSKIIAEQNMLAEVAPQDLMNIPHFVAVKGATIVGVVGIGRSNWFNTELLHLTVLPEYRRTKVATALCNFVKYYSKNSMNKKLLTCTVRDSNTPSNNLMVKMGFEKAVDFENKDNIVNYYILKL